MGSGTVFDPIKSIEAFGLGEFNQEATQMGTIPDTTHQTGATLAQPDAATYSEAEEAKLRKNVTKKRLGTGQARIPLQATTVNRA